MLYQAFVFNLKAVSDQQLHALGECQSRDEFVLDEVFELWRQYALLYFRFWFFAGEAHGIGVMVISAPSNPGSTSSVVMWIVGIHCLESSHGIAHAIKDSFERS